MLVLLMLSQRSLILAFFFFILFAFSVLQQWFPPLCLPVHLFILQPHLFCQSFQCIFHFSYCISQFCLFFKSSISWSNISCIFSVCASILFLRSWIIFSTTLNYFFRKIAYLHFTWFILLEFYLVPFLGTCFSAISFCLTSVFASCVLQAVGLQFFLLMLSALK